MFRLVWRMTRGYRLRPWSSPYLRWRIETYSGLDADAIGFREFCSFAWRARRELTRYLLWAARMERAARPSGRPSDEAGPSPRGFAR